LRENEVENELVQIDATNLRDNEEENELIQIDAMMIEPSISESSTKEATSNPLPEHPRLPTKTRSLRFTNTDTMPEYHTKLVWILFEKIISDG
jgi:hypothetical protein